MHAPQLLPFIISRSFSWCSLSHHMLHFKEFLPIINPPETGILAIGKIEERVIAEDRKIEIQYMMSVSLACDHRAVDGAYGAQFLNRFKEIMEAADFRTTKW